MDKYLLVATVKRLDAKTVSQLDDQLRKSRFCEYTILLDLPKCCKFRNLDELVSLSDTLTKLDSTAERICRNIEKTTYDLNLDSRFVITVQRSGYRIDSFLRNLKWDEVRYNLNRSIRHHVELMEASLLDLDGQVRQKTMQLVNLLTKRDSSTLFNLSDAQVIDLITTQNLSFIQNCIYTEHLTTVFCFVPALGIKSFLEKYARFTENIVPESHAIFVKDDKTTVFSIVLFRSSVTEFQAVCRTERVACRLYEHKEEDYAQYVAMQQKLSGDICASQVNCQHLLAAAFSECFIISVHLKLANLYVETTLRYGMNSEILFLLLKLMPNAKTNSLNEMISNKIGVRSAMQDYCDKQVEEETIWSFVACYLTPLNICTRDNEKRKTKF